jgi:hypothetical protein
MARKKQSKRSKQSEAESDDDFYSATTDCSSLDYQLLDFTLIDKQRSRIQRQMKARRELERRKDEENLKALINDEWLLDTIP